MSVLSAFRSSPGLFVPPPEALVLIVGLAPGLALFAVSLGLAVSLRIHVARSAQQLTMAAWMGLVTLVARSRDADAAYDSWRAVAALSLGMLVIACATLLVVSVQFRRNRLFEDR